MLRLSQAHYMKIRQNVDKTHLNFTSSSESQFRHQMFSDFCKTFQDSLMHYSDSGGLRHHQDSLRLVQWCQQVFFGGEGDGTTIRKFGCNKQETSYTFKNLVNFISESYQGAFVQLSGQFFNFPNFLAREQIIIYFSSLIFKRYKVLLYPLLVPTPLASFRWEHTQLICYPFH